MARPATLGRHRVGARTWQGAMRGAPPPPQPPQPPENPATGRLRGRGVVPVLARQVLPRKYLLTVACVGGVGASTSQEVVAVVQCPSCLDFPMLCRRGLRTMGPKMFTIDEAAEIARVSRRTVVREIARGHLRAVRVGHSWRVRAEDLDAWLQPVTPETARAVR